MTRTPVLWDRLAWPAFRPGGAATVADGEPVGLVPVGATEQHGPHLPTGTDTLVAQALCEQASALTGAVVLPAVNVGVSFGHGHRIPGTLSLSGEVMAHVLIERAVWAADSGVKRLLFVNAHAGNVSGVGLAVDHLRFEHPDLRAGAFHWWTATPEVTAELSSDGDDIHANRGETSVMLALFPELVDLDAMKTADDEDRTGGLVFAYTADSLSTNGVTGRPSEATAELGEKLVDLAVAALAERVRAGRVEQPPLAAQEAV